MDTVTVYLDPSPLKLLATDARVRRIPGEQTLQVTGFRQQRSRGQQLSGSQTSLTFTFENIELVDATGERIALSLIKDDEAVATGGRFLDHTLDVGMKRVDGRPPIGKIYGTFEVVMSGMRSVCGRRSAVRTVRKHLAVD